jgi:hypothetical protein
MDKTGRYPEIQGAADTPKCYLFQRVKYTTFALFWPVLKPLYTIYGGSALRLKTLENCRKLAYLQIRRNICALRHLFHKEWNTGSLALITHRSRPIDVHVTTARAWNPLLTGNDDPSPWSKREEARR